VLEEMAVEQVVYPLELLEIMQATMEILELLVVVEEVDRLLVAVVAVALVQVVPELKGKLKLPLLVLLMLETYQVLKPFA
jgi:hypothetical protein